MMKALLVDLDDTLLDYSGGVEESWREALVAAASHAGFPLETLVQAVARSRRWFWDDAARHRLERIDMQGAWTKIAAHALTTLDRSDADLAAAIAEAFAESRWKRMTLFPGVHAALTALRDQGVALALVTNGDRRHQRRKIDDHGLGRFFDAVVIEGEFGVGKPDESVYRHALAALGVKPADAWMVGDHLEWDVGAPQRLGLTGVWVDAPGQGVPAGHPVVPDRVVRAFVELTRP
jgi:putative hydrolase of the HAD superfamily